MIQIEHLTKCYGNSDKKAVDDITLSIEGGEIFGFLGPNGAGKSTTIKCLTGILPFQEGSIKICGIDVKQNPVEAKKHIGFVPDEHNMYEGLSGLEYVNFIADIFGVDSLARKERIEKYAGIFKMQEALKSSISSYSHGMKQKISLIAALVHQPDIWVLDEPMTGLDPQSAFDLKQLMFEHVKEGKLVFFSSHVLEVVEKICTKVAIIDKGKLLTVCDMSELRDKRGDMSLEQLFLSLTNAVSEGGDNESASGTI